MSLPDPSHKVAGQLDGESFRACVKSVKVRGKEMELFKSTSRKNTEEGCPAPPGEDTMPNVL